MYSSNEMENQMKPTHDVLSGGTRFHHLLIRNKHLLSEIKLSVILTIGGIVIIVCLVYIFVQCRSRSGSLTRLARNRRRDDEKELVDSTDTLENLLPADAIKLKVRKEQEFYV